MTLNLNVTITIAAPDPKRFKASVQYFAALVARTHLSQQECAEVLGIPMRTFRRYLEGRYDYPVQYSLEALALACEAERAAFKPGEMSRREIERTLAQLRAKQDKRVRVSHARTRNKERIALLEAELARR